MIEVSVEISTFDRKDVLKRVLEGLARQTCPADRFEVVLSDDGSSDGLLEMVEAMVPELPFPVQLLRGEHHGPSHAHNRGIRACRGELVIMLASDILPVPELVAEHLKSHREHPAPAVVVVGRLTQSKDLSKGGVQRGLDALNEDVFRNRSKTVRHGGFLVSNLSFKKSFMLEKGMFEEWPPASGEDLELGYRLRKHGMVLIENPLALGYHHHEETLESVARRAYVTGYNCHHLVNAVDEGWLEARFGRASAADGIAGYLKKTLRDLARPLFVNRLATKLALIPLIRVADRANLPARFVAFLCERAAAYYFAIGLSDQRCRRELDISRAEI